MLFLSNWHQMVALLCHLWTLMTIARAANLLNLPLAFMLKMITILKLENLQLFFIKFAPNSCCIVPLVNLKNMTRTANLLNPLVVLRLKNMTTPASKNTTVMFIKFSKNFCFIMPLVDFDQNCKYL